MTPQPPPSAERLSELLDVTETAARFIREHGLYAHSLEAKPGYAHATRFSHNTGRHEPVKPTVTVMMFNRPVEFLRWVDHLQVGRIVVKRRDHDTCLWFSWDREHDGQVITWHAASTLPRPADSPHLPGIVVEWDRLPSGRRGDDAWITAEDLRTAMTNLGVVEVSA
jgi:hypothetical protein